MTSVAFVVSTFARQFERKGVGYLYRKNLRGAAIRVTAEERDAFVADFRRNYIATIVAMVGFIGVALIVAIALGWLGDGADPVRVGIGFAGLAIVTIAGLGAAIHRIYDAPRRELASRAAEAPALTTAEASKMTFDSFGYGTLAMVAIFGFVITGFQAIKYDIWHGWGRLYWSPAVFLVGLAAIQAVRKWRFERTR